MSARWLIQERRGALHRAVSSIVAVASRFEQVHTARLLRRRRRDSDQALFANLNSDPEVMRYFPSLLNRSVSDDLIDRFEHRVIGLPNAVLPDADPCLVLAADVHGIAFVHEVGATLTVAY